MELSTDAGERIVRGMVEIVKLVLLKEIISLCVSIQGILDEYTNVTMYYQR